MAASRRVNTRHIVVPAGTTMVNPSRCWSASSRSYSQSTIAANEVAPARTAQTATVSSATRGYRVPWGFRGSGIRPRASISPACSLSVTGGVGVPEPGVVTVSAEIRDDVIGGWSSSVVVQRQKLHDHLEGFTRFIRLHRGHSPHEIPVQRPAPGERNSPASLILRESDKGRRELTREVSSSDQSKCL